MINRLAVLLYTIYASLVFLIFMFLYLPLIIPPLIFKLNGNQLSYFGLHLWAQSFRTFSGIRYRVRGTAYLESGKSYIFTPNHTSFLDIPALPLIAHRSFKPLAKKEVGHIPVFGLVAKAVTVMVDRSNAAHRKQSVIRLTKALKAGTSLVVYPEGTVNKTSQPLTHFYDGAFRIALETQTAIVPVVVLGASSLMRPKSWLMRPGLIEVDILAPVEVQDLSPDQLPELKSRVYEIMESHIREKMTIPQSIDIKKDTAHAVPF